MFNELERSGERSYLSTVAPMLAEIHLRRGDTAAASELATMGRSLTLEEDVVSQAMWRSVMAQVLARNGDRPAPDSWPLRPWHGWSVAININVSRIRTGGRLRSSSWPTDPKTAEPR